MSVSTSQTHRAREKKTPERRDSSWSQDGFFCIVMKVESTRVILSVTPKDWVLQITMKRENWTVERLTHRPVKFG